MVRFVVQIIQFYYNINSLERNLRIQYPANPNLASLIHLNLLKIPDHADRAADEFESFATGLHVQHKYNHEAQHL